MAGLTDPILLVQKPVTPYGYVLTPADTVLLRDADIVLWVGGALERFLVRPLVPLSRRARLISLLEQDSVQVVRFRRKHQRGRGDPDPNVWLNAANARRIARVMANALIAEDPGRGDLYKKNAAATDARLAALDQWALAWTAPVRNVPFIVYRDLYGYLVRHYRLNALGSILEGDGGQPDEYRISEIRQTIFSLGVRCVFMEPGYNQNLATDLIRDTGAKLAVLDPYGLLQPPGPENYFTAMRALIGTIGQCLRRR
jgi:zinc transport system substrate-binding protein